MTRLAGGVGIALGAALLASVQVAAAQPIIHVRGVVVEAGTGAPVAGAVITAGGELAATADDGTFEILMPPGKGTLEITAPWLVTARIPVTAVAGASPLKITVALAEQLGGETVEVTDLAPTQPGQMRVDAKLARTLPGGGDAAKVVHSLPAVARPPAGSAEIVVWGAAPRDTRVFVDGVPVVALYHLGGYRAAIGNDLVGDLRLTPAAFGPERGRAIGGVIDIGLADPAELPDFRVQADVLDASAEGKTKLGRFTIAAAARQSWLDRAIALVADPKDLAPNAPLPRWSDAQVLVRGKLADHLELSGWVLGALDDLERSLASDDPATQTTQELAQRTVRAQVTLAHTTPSDADGLHGGRERVTLWGGRDTTTNALRVGELPATEDSAAWVAGARASEDRRVGERVGLTVGADLDGERARLQRTGSLTIPAREGDEYIFGQPPGDDTNADRWFATTIDAAVHATVDVHAKFLTASAGARLDGWLLGASRLTPRVGTTPGIAAQAILFDLDPRGSLQARLGDAASVQLDAGRYHQARAASDTSAVFGTPNLGLEQAWHVTLGGQWQRPPFAIEAAGYSRWLEDLVARDLAATPLVAQSLTQGGTGRVVGVQITARIVGWHGLSGWVSYGLSKSTRKDAASQAERYFDHDQTHGFIAVGGWEHGPWSLGGRVRIATGEPRTGVVGAFFDSHSGRYQPIRGAHNGERLPTFFAADARAERRFGPPAATHRLRGAVYAELQNLTGRANAEEIIYSADFTQKGYLTSLPLVGIVGVRLER